MILDTPQPFTKALDRLKAQSLLPTGAGSRRLAELDPAIRERAFFSARVVHVGFLEHAQRLVAQITSPVTTRQGGAPVLMDRAKARLLLKQELARMGWTPEAEGVTPGSLQDLTSNGRLNLILDTNTDLARGYGNWAADQDEDLLATWPAQELIRLEDREEERDWAARWIDAGGQIFDGRLIAPKNDPIWTAISAFGLPYPPFDFNSGMGVRDVGYREAVALGVITRGQTPQPQTRDFNAQTYATIPSDRGLIREVATAFRDRVEVEGDRLVLKPKVA